MNNKIKSLIMLDEGFRDKMYIDTLGHPTIGFGFNLENVKLPIIIAKYWLNNILDDLEYSMRDPRYNWYNLNEARQYVLLNMAYNLGLEGLNKFKKFLYYIQIEDYINAEKEMADSLWDKQLPLRSERLRKIMVSGEFNDE